MISMIVAGIIHWLIASSVDAKLLILRSSRLRNDCRRGAGSEWRRNLVAASARQPFRDDHSKNRAERRDNKNPTQWLSRIHAACESAVADQRERYDRDTAVIDRQKQHHAVCGR